MIKNQMNNNIILLQSLKGVNSLEKWKARKHTYFQKSGYYLGCQLALDSECHMFINFDSKRDTGRGNIEIFEDGTINWFYTINTNTVKEQLIIDIKKTPEWFQKIYYYTIKGKQKQVIKTA